MIFQVQNLKEKGNNCVREQKYEEAMYHYTLGIKMDPQNYSLYSNRSLAFLRMQQYHLSMEDALMTIQIKPDWTKVRYFFKFFILIYFLIVYKFFALIFIS